MHHSDKVRAKCTYGVSVPLFGGRRLYLIIGLLRLEGMYFEMVHREVPTVLFVVY